MNMIEHHTEMSHKSFFIDWPKMCARKYFHSTPHERSSLILLIDRGHWHTLIVVGMEANTTPPVSQLPLHVPSLRKIHGHNSCHPL